MDKLLSIASTLSVFLAFEICLVREMRLFLSNLIEKRKEENNIDLSENKVRKFRILAKKYPKLYLLFMVGDILTTIVPNDVRPSDRIIIFTCTIVGSVLLVLITMPFLVFFG